MLSTDKLKNSNTVELIGWYGSDEIVACSAWTSTDRELTPEKRGRIPQLIKKLWEDGHETPFEKIQFHFLVNTDIATHIHLLKHRISSINAESARYKELKEDKYYLPEDWKGIPGFILNDGENYGNAGSYFHGCNEWIKILSSYTQLGNQLYHQCLADLTPILGRKRAKESARYFKTYNSQVAADVLFNGRSFMNFQKLRNSEHAQKEIRELSQKMLELIKNIPDNPFQYTLQAWGK